MKNTLVVVLVLVVIVILALSSRHSHGGHGELRIGVISALTGNVAFIGESTKKGADLGREKVLKDNPGMNITLFHEDSQFIPKVGIDAYNKLKSANNINGLVVMASNVSMGVKPLADADQMLFVAASTLANNFSSPNDTSARMTPKGDVEAAPALEYLASIGKKKIGIVYMTNDIGISLRDALVKEASRFGVEIVAQEGFDPASNDFNTIIAKLKNQKVDGVYVAALASHLSVFVKQAQGGIPGPYFSYRAAEDPMLINNLGTLAEQVVYTSTFDPNSSNQPTAEFRDLYMNKYGEAPNTYAAEAYEAVRLIADVFHECDEDKECQKEYLQNVKNRPSALGNLTFDINGDVAYPFHLKTVRAGQFVKLVE